MTFKKYKFSENQIKRYFNAAKKDFSASIKLKNHDIQFRIAYDALLKMSIAVCANEGLMVDSKRGHHKELIEELSRILKRKDIRSIGNEIRRKRNFDLYSGGLSIPEKEIKDLILWLKEVFIDAEGYLQNKKGQNKMI